MATISCTEFCSTKPLSNEAYECLQTDHEWSEEDFQRVCGVSISRKMSDFERMQVVSGNVPRVIFGLEDCPYVETLKGESQDYEVMDYVAFFKRLKFPSYSVFKLHMTYAEYLRLRNGRGRKKHHKLVQAILSAYFRMCCNVVHSMTNSNIEGRNVQLSLANRFVAIKATLQSAHENIVDGVIKKLGDIRMKDAVKAIGNITGFFDTPLVQNIERSMAATIDHPVQGRSLGTMAKDLAIAPNFYSQDIDPSDIVARSKTPARVAVIQWTTTNTAGTQLPIGPTVSSLVPLSIPITPSFCDCTAVTTPVPYTYTNDTPLSFFAKYYQLWRGSIRVTFEVINTRFHQGQLFIAYVPANYYQGLTYNMSSTIVSFNDAKNCICASIDLSESNRTEMIIPYYSPYDYQRTAFEAEGGNNGPWLACNISATGGLFVYVQNPLDAASTVPNSVEVNVYFAAGDDFEFKVIGPTEAYLSYTNGVYQSGTGDVLDSTTVDATVGQINRPTRLDLAKLNASEADSADTVNVFEREYIIGSFDWSVLNTGIIYTAELPLDYFANVGLSVVGLRNYHFLLHTDFEVRVRLNPTPFHMGMAILFWSPFEQFDTVYSSVNSITQFPHAFINVGVDRESILHIPYSHLSKLMVSNNPTFGFFYVYVWNRLNVAAGQSNTLHGTVWCKAKDAYIAVKTAYGRVSNAIFQSGFVDESQSDSTRGQASEKQLMGTGVNQNTHGYITEKHDTMLHLLRRMDGFFTNNAVLAVTPPGQVFTFLRTGPINGPRHLALLRTVTFWAGNNRTHILSATNFTQNLVYVVWPEYALHTDGYVALGITHPINQVLMKGAQYMRIQDDGVCTLELPYYNITPFALAELPTFSTSVNCGSFMYAVIMTSQSWAGTTTNVNFTIAHSVGDNFTVHLRRNMPTTRFAGTVAQRIAQPYDLAAAAQNTLLLRGGDIEQNPGPIFSKNIFSRPGPAPVVPPRQQGYSLLNSIRNILTMTSDDELCRAVREIAPKINKTVASVEWILGHLDFFFDVFITVCELVVAVMNRSLAALTLIGMRVAKWSVSKAIATSTEQIRGVVDGIAQSGDDLFGMDFAEFVHDSKTRVCERWILRLFKWLMNKLGWGFASLEKYFYLSVAMQPSLPRLYVLVTCALEIMFDGDNALTSYVESRTRDITAVVDEIKSHKKDLENPIWRSHNSKKIKYYENVLSTFTHITTYIKLGSPALAGEVRTALETLKNSTRRFEANRGKPEPILTYLYGSPGCGKSQILNVLCSLYARMFGLDADYYTFPTTVEGGNFLDGYRGQDIAVIDDALATTDPEQVVNLIKFISPMNVVVPMAHLEDKGITFTSKMMVATSNTKTIQHIDGIVERDAFYRRIHFGLHLQPRDAFRSRDSPTRIDAAKVMEHLSAVKEDEPTVLQDFIFKLDQIYNVRRFYPCERDREDPYSFARYFDDLKIRWGQGQEIHVKSMTLKETILGVTQAGITRRRPVELTAECAIHSFEDMSVAFRLQCVTILEKFAIKKKVNQLTLSDVHFCNMYTFIVKYDYCKRVGLSAEWDVIKKTCVDHEAEYFGDVDANEYDDVVVEELENLHDKSQRGIIEQFLQRYCEVDKPCYGFMHYFKWAVGATGLAAVLYWSITAFQGLCTNVLGGVFQGAYDNIKHVKERHAQRKQPQQTLQTIMGLTQGATVEDREQVIAKNLRLLEYYTIDGLNHYVHVLAVNNQRVLVPKHFIADYKSDLRKGNVSVPIRIELWSPTDIKRYEPLDVTNVTLFGEDKDVCMITTRALTHCRDILSYFVKRKEYERFAVDGDQKRVVLCGDKHGTLKRGDLVAVYRSSSEVFGKSGSGQLCKLTWMEPLNALTKQGDCGRPYLLPPNYESRIFALHSMLSLDDRFGATIITYEMLEPHCGGDKCIVQDAHFQLGIIGTPVHWWNTDITNCGETTINGDSLARDVVMKTNFVRFELHGKKYSHPDWEDDMLPAAQHPVGDAHPLYTCSQKYDTTPLIRPSQAMHDYIVKYYVDTRKLKSRGVGALTIDQALNYYGEGEKATLPLVLNTSSGYWSKLGFADGKKQILENDAPEGSPKHLVFTVKAKTQKCSILIDGERKTFVEYLDWCDNEIRHARVPPMPWTTSTKDELRPSAKVKQCKTRCFEMPGLEFTILARKYFGDFAYYVKSRPGFKYHHGIGNDKPTVWKYYWQRMTARSDVGFDVDYKNYDGSVPQCAFDFFQDVVDAYYDDDVECKAARHCLIDILKNSWLIIGKNVCHTSQGNKSGNPLTDLFNSITNTYVVYAVFCMCRAEVGLSMDLHALDLNVLFLTYGDDIILAVVRTVLAYFNRCSFARFAALLGMTVTSARKDERMVEYDSLYDLTFLSSGFVPIDGVVLAPMKKSAIYKELQWQPKNTRDSEVDFKERVHNISLFIAEHGEGEFKKFVQQANDLEIPASYVYLGDDDSGLPITNYDHWLRVKRAAQDAYIDSMNMGYDF